MRNIIIKLAIYLIINSINTDVQANTNELSHRSLTMYDYLECDFIALVKVDSVKRKIGTGASYLWLKLKVKKKYKDVNNDFKSGIYINEPEVFPEIEKGDNVLIWGSHFENSLWDIGCVSFDNNKIASKLYPLLIEYFQNYNGSYFEYINASGSIKNGKREGFWLENNELCIYKNNNIYNTITLTPDKKSFSYITYSNDDLVEFENIQKDSIFSLIKADKVMNEIDKRELLLHLKYLNTPNSHINNKQQNKIEIKTILIYILILLLMFQFIIIWLLLRKHKQFNRERSIII